MLKKTRNMLKKRKNAETQLDTIVDPPRIPLNQIVFWGNPHPNRRPTLLSFLVGNYYCVPVHTCSTQLSKSLCMIRISTHALFFRTLSVAPGVFQKLFGAWHSESLVMTAGRCRKCSGRHWWNLQFGQMMRNQNQWSMPRTGHGWGFGSPIVAGIPNYTRKLSCYHVYLVHKLACDIFGFWNAQGWVHFAACSEF